MKLKHQIEYDNDLGLREAGLLANGDHETDASEFCKLVPGSLLRMIIPWSFDPLSDAVVNPRNLRSGDVLMYLGVLPVGHLNHVEIRSTNSELAGELMMVEFTRSHAWLSQGTIIYFNNFRLSLNNFAVYESALDNIFEIVALGRS